MTVIIEWCCIYSYPCELQVPERAAVNGTATEVRGALQSVKIKEQVCLSLLPVSFQDIDYFRLYHIWPLSVILCLRHTFCSRAAVLLLQCFI